jgi:hypothetical protein
VMALLIAMASLLAVAFKLERHPRPTMMQSHQTWPGRSPRSRTPCSPSWACPERHPHRLDRPHAATGTSTRSEV